MIHDRSGRTVYQKSGKSLTNIEMTINVIFYNESRPKELSNLKLSVLPGPELLWNDNYLTHYNYGNDIVRVFTNKMFIKIFFNISLRKYLM